MELTQLTPAALTELIHLAEEKQTILARIEKIDADLRALISGSAVASKAIVKMPRATAPKPLIQAAKPTVEAPKAAAPVRAKRGALKEGILAALEAAGSNGVAVSELAAKLGVEAANVHVWFATTGKKLSHVTKVAPGRYAIGAAAVAPVVAAKADAEPTPVAVVEVISTPVPAEEIVAIVEEFAAPVLAEIEEAVERIVELDAIEETEPVVVVAIDEAPVAEEAPSVAEEPAAAPANEEFHLAAAQ